MAGLRPVVRGDNRTVRRERGNRRHPDARCERRPERAAPRYQQASDAFGAGAATAASERLLIVIDGGTGAASDPRFQASIASFVADLQAAHATVDGSDSPTFDQVTDPFTVPPAAGLVSADGTTVQVVGNVPGERAQVEQRLKPVLPIVDAARAAMPSATIHVIGNTFINQEINDLISHQISMHRSG